MRQTLKRFARISAGYSLVAFIGPTFTILLTPLYTRALSPADYGVVDVAFTLSGLLSIFVMLGMDGALNATFFDGDETHQRNLVTMAAILVATAGIGIGIVMSLLAVPLAELLYKDPGRRFIMYLLAVGLVTGSVAGILGAGLRLQMGVRRVNALALSSLLATVGSNILFVLVLRLKATGIVAASTVVNILVCGIALALVYKPLRGRFSPPLLTPLLRAGLGLLPGALGFLLLANVDRLLLTQFVSQNDIGLYAIANKLTSMFWVAFTVAWSAWLPLALGMANQPDAPQQYARMFELFAAGSMILALGLGVFAPEILTVFTRDVYVPAAPYALVLLIASGPLGVANGSFQIGLYARKRTYLISAAFLIAATLNIALNFALTPIIGVWGAVLATLAGNFLVATLSYRFSQRTLRVPYAWQRIVRLSVVYLGLTLAFLLVPALNTMIFKVGALIVLSLAILAVGVVTLNHIQIGLQAVRYRLARLAQPRG